MRSDWQALTVFGAAVMASTLSASDATIYVRIFPFAIFALSLVPLTGFAGQISLCQLSFAAIGASIWAQWGTHGNPIILLWAALVAAVIGALIALPRCGSRASTSRSATAAFAVTLDRWIWPMPPIKIFGLFTLNLFQTGSVSASPLTLFGYDFDTASRQIMLLATVLALLTLLVVWIRRSAFGRRLLAMRDSEAACATLGMRLLMTKTAVFAISAGMAGLGGALYASQLQSVQITTFNFIVGLPVLLAAVVGGMAYAGTGPFSGVSLQAGLPLLAKIGPFFANLAGLLPGLAGIGLGRNPNGAIADMRDAFGRAWRDKRIFGAIIGRRDRHLAAAGRRGLQELGLRDPRRTLGTRLAAERRGRRPAGSDARGARSATAHGAPRVGRSDGAVARRRPRRAGPPARGDGCGAARCLLRSRPRSRPPARRSRCARSPSVSAATSRSTT